jgi:hypothetical protein
VSGDPLLRLKRDIHEGLEVIETEWGTVTPFPSLILKWARKGCCEERSLLADILLDRGVDVAASQRWSPVVWMKSWSPWCLLLV